MIGIGPKLPLRRDSEHGFYGLTTTFPEQINQNFKYLPFIEVNKISFDQDLSEDFAKDSQILNLSIDYSIPGLNLNTSLVLSTDGTNKIWAKIKK